MKRNTSQKTLFRLKDFSSEFGGSLLAGKRKLSKPISTKNTMKLVLRADLQKSIEQAKAFGTDMKSLLKYRKEIDSAFARFAEKFGVKIFEKALVSNHIHFVAKFNTRDQYRQFIRALTGTLSKQLKIKWLIRPWTRIIAWGRAVKTAIQYTKQNHLEAIGVIPYQPRPKDIKTTRDLRKTRKLLRMNELL